MKNEFYNLGVVFFKNQQYDEAIEIFEKALQLNPGLINACNYIGNSFQEKKQFDKAIRYYEKALQINPSDPTAYMNIGIACHNTEHFDKAVEYFKRAIYLNPNIEEAYNYMGLTLIIQGKLEEALKSYRSLLQINPSSFIALNKTGSILRHQGKLNESETYYRIAMQIHQNNLIAHESLLMGMLYNPCHDPQTIFSEHLRFAKHYAEALSSNITTHANERITTRRLKIGYISPDFKRHPVSHFIEPVLMLHDRKDFEIFCYGNVLVPDEVTERLQSYADHWRSIVGLSDDEAAELIRKDLVDILVDLAGHTGGNRIFIFARKPAPIQVTWIGYPATTGLSTIDYKIVDSYTDPPGMTEQFYTEKLIRLPESFVCYHPYNNSPEVNTLPVLTSGHVTFGSFNDFAKVTPEVFILWGRILKAIPDSYLILKNKSLSDMATCNYARDMFTQQGITAERIELLPRQPSIRAHLSIYNKVDIGLDTFPYNGTTTTCEAMWMGVPVITLAGTGYAARAGVSLLSNVGLTELIARTQDEYVEIAIKLANDIEKLHFLRDSLRDMVARSPLTDTKQFTIYLEQCYRKMWENWCELN